ncbi:hypothetical protein [Ornithinimicrobium tianjinense]|uniref:Uncharacterized protein n=1 Tax=Ornithinimicrobium tianjinense TaxID=1195761 RepID=A0A917BH48_9MICO|nr:hypothetical protein [Ornithinimicrobium tianjinense]GGF38815.1 hypothetical protein GCM10011366_02980 [Ornithinimicrobium tianjinense]
MSDDQARALEIGGHPTHVQREHRLANVGWVVLGLFVLAGLVGFLGAGPWSNRTTGAEGDVVRVEHQRVSHYEAEDVLTIHVAEEAIDGDTLDLELTGDWLRGTDLSAVFPEPDAQRVVPGGAVLEFAVERPGDVAIVLSFRPQKLGDLELTAAAGGSTVTVDQFILP